MSLAETINRTILELKRKVYQGCLPGSILLIEPFWN